MVLVNNPGDWSHIYPPLRHAAWNGCTFTDWIFPFFLFIVGVSMALSIDRARTTGVSPRTLLLKLWRRSLLIVAIGLALNFIPAFDVSTWRLPGVLQRIGLCSMIAAPAVLVWRSRGLGVLALCLLAAYALVMLTVPVPDVNGVVIAGALEPGRDVGAFIDRRLLGGHLWSQSKTWDPEGLLSTLPAVATLLMGALTGRWLLTQRAPAVTAVWMMLAGLISLYVGVVLDTLLMPTNKSLWTPSYVAYTGGWALLLLAASYWLIDGCDQDWVRRRATQWLRPFEIYGVNALFVFVVSGLIAKALATIKFTSVVTGEVATAAGAAATTVSLKALLYGAINRGWLEPVNASLTFALCFNALMFLLAYGLWRRRIFIKL
ncbi:MAG: hypothetical protein JNL19_15565 [Burkholderiales bacterium]|nr:hypothetical protein [Burkholderiales bacterium]